MSITVTDAIFLKYHFRNGLIKIFTESYLNENWHRENSKYQFWKTENKFIKLERNLKKTFLVDSKSYFCGWSI